MAVSTDIFVAAVTMYILSVVPPASCTSVSPSIPSMTVNNQTTPCKLYSVTMFDCSARNLSATPIDIPITLTHLDISINRISNLTGFNFLSSLKTLNCSINIIQTVIGSAFQGLVSLQILDLSQNSISFFADGAFMWLKNLVRLDLSSNNIVSIPTATFEGLGEILELSLWLNDLTEVPSDALANLRKIETLDLSFNQVKQFELGLGFQSLRNLKRLLLFGMNIEFLANSTLSALSSLPLEYIDFSLNDLVYIDTGAFYPVPNIKGLSLRETSYQIIDVLPSGLFELDLSRVDSVVSNGVLTVRIAESLSRHLPKVTSISFAENKIRWIEDSALGKLATLEKLDLSLNQLKASGMTNGTFSGLHNLEELHLSDNHLNEVPRDALTPFNVTGFLRRLNLAGNSLIRLNADDFASVPLLTSLNLERNGIYNLDNCLDNLQNLKFLYLANNQFYRLPPAEGWVAPLRSLRLLDMSHNPGGEYLTNTLSTLAPALEEMYVSNIRDDFELSILLNCTSLITLDVSHNGLTDNDFYTRGLYGWSALNLPKLKTLNLAGNAMQSLRVNVFQRTPRLRWINCSRNSIEDVDGKTFENVTDIMFIDLSENQLTNLSALSPSHLPNLHSAIFSGNKISFVDVELLKESRLPSLSFLDLSHNPFSCTCDVQDFNQWIIEDVRVFLPSPLEYKCNSPSNLQGYLITQLVFDQCVSHLALYLGVSSAAALICIFTVTIFCVRYHWHLRYKWFLLFPRRRLIKREVREESNTEEGRVNNNPPKFDAFVSYNDHDQEWVVNQLIPRLEEDPNEGERFRLCVSERDIDAGGSRTDAVVGAIHDSRKTILVLSDHFMESEWCYYEMQMAHQRLFNEGQDVLILILLKDVSDSKMTLLLRQTLCRKTYFKWPHDNLGQQLFWDRLKAELKMRSIVNRRVDTQSLSA
ncbi:toll-like receptor 4 [Asterias rubens]|uniref:toll-like receptor 4 n=1 Tax=Asterias rubens TaxID=7604 RepID=UPI0014559800|nr:toll-like receptor 4 [Asterias rubens]